MHTALNLRASLSEDLIADCASILQTYDKHFCVRNEKENERAAPRHTLVSAETAGVSEESSEHG